MDRHALLADMRDGRAQLEAALAAFSPHQMERSTLPGGWSIKDLLAHLGFWERRIATLYVILSSGDVPLDAVDEGGTDGVNARVYAENRALPLETVVANEQSAYEALLAVAETAPEADLFDPARFAWTEGEAFYGWIIGNAHGHYADHIPDLLSGQ